MARYIEYYEVETANGNYNYYFMPLDADAKNKENYDNRSSRIWKVDTKTNRFEEVINRRKDRASVTKMELFTMSILAEPVPWCETYLMLEEARRRREAKESSTSD